MHLTRRGYGLVAVVIGAELMAIAYGGSADGRALNAIAAPAVIALIAAVIQVRRMEYPTVDRGVVNPGFPGDTRELSVEVDGEGTASIVDKIPAGAILNPDARGGVGTSTLPSQFSSGSSDEPTTAETETTLPAELTYAIKLQKRGRHDIGPAEVWVSDVLGLVAEHYEFDTTTQVLVYPPVYQVAGRETLLREIVDHSAVERQEFDSIREYVPGDPLRDVHWKSTAKDPGEMYVTEFADRRIDDTVVIAASSEDDAVDAMATAAASVAVMAIEADVGVELRTPVGDVPMGSGTDHRDRILRALALTTGGDPETDDLDDVDIHVHADADGVTLTLGSREHTLEEMTVSRENPLASREVSM